MRAPALLACLLAAAWLPAAAQPVAVEYRDKPPYSYTVAGKPAGFLLERAVRLFEQAGVPASFAEMPARRTMRKLQDNQTALCSLGLFRLPEREGWLRFSLPIHRSRPHAVLAHAGAAPGIAAMPSVRQLFADRSLQAGMVDGVSYGGKLDRALATTTRPAVRAQKTPLQLARMVGARHVDYMLIDEEDLAWLRQDASFAGLGLVRIEFADMPAGEPRYLACSLRVAPQTMDRLNQAIRALVPEAQPD